MSTTPPDVWATLLPVIIGGAIGFLGGIAGPPLTQLFASVAARRHRRIERFEELLGLVLEQESWLERTRLSGMYASGEAPTEPEPLRRANALCAIYFPELTEQMQELESANRRYQRFIALAAGKRAEGKIGDVNNGFDEAYKDYMNARHQTINGLTGFGQNKLKP